MHAITMLLKVKERTSTYVRLEASGGATVLLTRGQKRPTLLQHAGFPPGTELWPFLAMQNWLRPWEYDGVVPPEDAVLVVSTRYR